MTARHFPFQGVGFRAHARKCPSGLYSGPLPGSGCRVCEDRIGTGPPRTRSQITFVLARGGAVPLRSSQVLRFQGTDNRPSGLGVRGGRGPAMTMAQQRRVLRCAGFGLPLDSFTLTLTLTHTHEPLLPSLPTRGTSQVQ